MILKFLLIMAVIAVIYMMFFKTKSTTQVGTKKAKKAETTEPEINDMIECANCGVYVEVEEAILSNGKYYCSRECLKEAR